MSKSHDKPKSNPIVQYFLGSIEEFGKITWPTKEQAVMLTGIVVVFSSILSILLAALDLGLTELFSLTF